MLDLGVCRWDHIVLGISARSHVDAATLRRALERMDAAWSEGEERMAKLSVNAMIGLWARSVEVVYSVRSSSSELDGADFCQAFAYEGGVDAVLGTLNWASLPEGAYTGARLAAWVSSNFATATYSKTTNSLSVAYDGNRLILELRQQFPDAADYPAPLPPSPSAWTTCWARASSPAGSRSLSLSG